MQTATRGPRCTNRPVLTVRRLLAVDNRDSRSLATLLSLFDCSVRWLRLCLATLASDLSNVTRPAPSLIFNMHVLHDA